jgi:hypothetical protein
MKDPETTEQWQAAVDTVVAILNAEHARTFGLATINIARCREILERARAKGILPRTKTASVSCCNRTAD